MIGVQPVRFALGSYVAPVEVSLLAKRFKGANTKRLTELFETLASLG